MTVTWTTYAKMVDSVVLFGTGDKLDQTVKGRVTEFTDNGHRVHYINRATLAKLKPDTTYSKFKFKFKRCYNYANLFIY